VSQVVDLPKGMELRGPLGERHREVLTPAALAFVAQLHREWGSRRRALLARRVERQAAFDAGELPGFLPETAAVRESAWTVAPIPKDLEDRRVEITGPVERKMIINALNSGARVFMADFEDSCSPTWSNLIEGQINLCDAVRGTISYRKPDGRSYQLAKRTATLMVRPRGWHLPEKHVLVDGQPISGSLFDFGLFFFHNARSVLEKGSGPYFYLPKLESHLEARLWNDVFLMAQELLGLLRGTIRATVLIETLPAAFEMDEILWELREHSAGLNCGRWDYIFSFIKKLRSQPGFVLPDRGEVTMATHFLRSYSRLAIRTCHRRGIHAIGGMAAQIPVKDDPEANAHALAKVRADKERESQDGHDGTWVAHPALVPLATEIFDARMPSPNQIARARADLGPSAAPFAAPGPEIVVTRDDLLRVPPGAITERGLRHDIDVGIQYLESWLGGAGCVPIYNLMEDAATAEISRAQVWQWVRHASQLADGRTVDAALVRELIPEELEKIAALVGGERFAVGRYPLAARLFEELATDETLAEFLTLGAYEHLA
jgi:malate synthase